MHLNFESEQPIFLQIAEGLEDDILSGIFPEGGQIPSITEFSVVYKINPATALKGINLLVDRGIVYKRRGIGMFVSDGAIKKLREARQHQFYETYVLRLVDEARRLELSEGDIHDMIKEGFK